VPRASLGFKLAAIAVAAFVIGGVAAIAIIPGLGERLGGARTVTTGKALVGGPFSLIDHTGRRVTDRDYLGRYMLVYFGFTYCPDICPTGLQVIGAALDQIGNKADRITPVFITIDPERDTPEKLADYVRAFHPRMVGLTGSPEEIRSVSKGYRVYAKKVSDPRYPGDYTMDHTSIMYLMGPDGQFITHFTHATAVDVLASRLSKLN